MKLDSRTFETMLKKQSSNDFVDRAAINRVSGLSRKQIDKRFGQFDLKPLPGTCPQLFYIPHVAIAICDFRRKPRRDRGGAS